MSRAVRHRDPARMAVERWFVRRGLPHFIHGYSAREDVWTRALPLLLVLFVLGAGEGVDVEEGSPAVNLLFAGLGLVAVSVAWVVVNRRRGRPAFSRPQTVGRFELGVFLGVPLVPAWLGGGVPAAVVSLVSNALVLALIYVATSYAVVRISRWVFGRVLRQAATSLGLMVRALPLLLLIVALLFLTAELWQAVGTIHGLSYAMSVGLLLLAAFAFLTSTLTRESDDLRRFGSWQEIDSLAAASPGVPWPPLPAAPPAIETLPEPTRRQRANAALVLLAAEIIQVVVVSLLVGGFLTLFGMFAVSRATVRSWLGSEPNVVWTLTQDVVVTEPLLRVAGFVTAFTALYFSVTSLTDDTYRRQFHDDTAGELRLAHAVRLRYEASLAHSVAASPGTTPTGTPASGAGAPIASAGT